MRRHLPEYEPGGRSTLFTCAISLRLRRGEWITIGTNENKRIIGQSVKYKTHKNKTYKQQQSGMFDFYFEEGGVVPAGCIDTSKELIILSIVYGVVEKRGSWFFYKGKQLAQGTDNAVEVVRANAKMFDEIREATMKEAFSSDVVREDIFGTDEIIPEDLSIPVLDTKVKGKKEVTKK